MSKACACGTALAKRNTTGRCHPCAIKHAWATRPELREQRRRAGIASAARPGERERRSERARDQGLYRIGHAARDAETFKRMGQAISNTRMAWCPPELRDEARFLTYRKRFALAEVKKIIAAAHAAQMERWRRASGIADPAEAAREMMPRALPADTLPIRAIILRAAHEAGVTVETLLGPSRERPLARARWAAMLNLRERGCSISQIARIMKRDRASVRHGIEQAQYQRERDAGFAAMVRGVAA